MKKVIFFFTVFFLFLLLFKSSRNIISASVNNEKILPFNLIDRRSYHINQKGNVQSYLVYTSGNYFFKTVQNPEIIKSFFSSQLKTSSGTTIHNPIPNEMITFIKSRSFNNVQWYAYQQTIGGLPVFGSHFTAHVRENGLYSLSSLYVTDNTIPTSNITIEDAENIALTQASADFPNVSSFTISDSETVIFNPFLLGLGTTDQNYVVQKISVVSTEGPPIGNIYFVNLSDGQILLTLPLIKFALNRNIFNCSEYNSLRQSCRLRRTEGSPPVTPTISIAPAQANDINNTYTFLGNVYAFYNSYGRDSYNNKGSPLEAFVNITNAMINGFSCPNAAWNNYDNRAYICEGMASNDIIAHELSHAVTDTEINFVYANQSGALSEAFSDILAYGVDPDWTMGEDSVLGIIRNLDNPLIQNDPDRLFSPYYHCASSDYGGVHTNNTIISKAFYLLVQGENFNGCTLTPIGKDKSLMLFYASIMSGHLTATSNFYNLYTALNQTCNLLIQEGHFTQSDCVSVNRALQAVEIDQQPPNDQLGPICKQIARRTPECAESAQPTNTPTPTSSHNNNPHCVCSANSAQQTCSALCKDYVNESLAGYACASQSNCDTTRARTKGDNTGDGKTCLNDYSELMLAFMGKYQSNLEQLLYSDFNGNRLVDNEDMIILKQNYQPHICEQNF